MKTVNTILILAAAFLAVFAESAFGTRGLLGAQIDLLPALVVYAGLTGGLAAVALLAVCGGLGFDALSANPLGVSILPLFVIGYFIHRQRDLILRHQTYAQFVIGVAASLFAPLAVLLLLFTMARTPLVGWGTFWQLFVMAFAGGLLTPVCFKIFRFVRRTFFYESTMQPAFRPDRQIRRGRH